MIQHSSFVPGNVCLRVLVLVPAPRRTNFDLAQSEHAMALIEVMAMHIPHELQDEFPQETSLIERTIRTNYKFRRLAVRYDAVNRNIYSIESGEEPTTDEERWSRFAGQFGGLAKVDSGFDYAANFSSFACLA
jgi:uncharacterized protein YdcH (DUF465 family)